jgi:poly-gamma-glutamate synthesis protein (capsule biosynthesis protein)
MKKLLIVFSFLITGMFVFLINNFGFSPENAFVSFDKGEIEKINIIPDLVLPEKTFEALVFGSDNTLSEFENFDFEKYEKIIILSENKKNFGKFDIALKEDLLNFSAPSTGKSDFAFSKNKTDEKFRLFLKDKTKAKIFSISVKTFVQEKDLLSFFEKLQEKISGDTLVLSEIKYSQVEFKNLKQFHDDYTKSVLASLDAEKVTRLDSDSREIVKAVIALAKSYQLTYKEENNGVIIFDENGENFSRPIFVSAFGDIMLGRYVRTLMDIHGHDYPFTNIADENNRFFKGSDLVFANLEGPIKGDGFKSSTSMIFGFPQYTAPLLKKYGFNLLMLANNHAMNQGASGRDSTISALNEQDISWCGHPSKADPESVYYDEIAGKKIAFVCLNDVEVDLNLDEAYGLIADVRKKVDLLFVSAHFGLEYKHSASNTLQEIPFRKFIDSGADIVIGHHPHVVQNFEVYNGKIILYSLGNFIFDQYWSKDTQEMLGVGISIDSDKTKVFLLPLKSDKSKPRLMNEIEYKDFIERFSKYGNYDEVTLAQIRAGIIEIVNKK